MTIQSVCIYDPAGCKAINKSLSTDRFCTTGRRKPRDDIKDLMRESEPKGRRKNGKWVSN